MTRLFAAQLHVALVRRFGAVLLFLCPVVAILVLILALIAASTAFATRLKMTDIVTTRRNGESERTRERERERERGE